MSLQIMRDPVSTMTGITYERESIEKWPSKSSSNGAATTCLTSRRRGFQPHPEPHAPPAHPGVVRQQREERRRPDPDPEVILRECCVLKLVKELVAEHSIVEAMKELEELAEENKRNRMCMVGH
ncbi:hypothetical protein ACJRO7_018878 [Eucalyptus globulus]|uniref:U-box domain-containing protein n=1 Tax=Eucalyptus globulus TaxID=34317 RepID=A0ABD3L1H2_EUCGL